MIHIVDAASTEGRDPIEDIYAIDRELKKYNTDLASRPQIIAANKIDAISHQEVDPVSRLKAEFEPKGVRVFPISAVSGQGVTEMLYYVSSALDTMEDVPVIFEQEYFPETEISSNREMRKRGIRCAKEDELRIWGRRHGKENPTCSDLGCGDCSGCEISTDTDKQQKI